MIMDPNITVNVTYCNLTQFANTYRGLHGYLSLLVCIFGSVTNVFNICVLTTREMRWPTNLILTGLAVTDLLVMLEYIPFVAHYYLIPKAKQMHSDFSYPWAVFTYFHAMFTQICHFISCCLTVILAIWRYIAISKTNNNVLRRTVTSIPRTLLTIFLTYLCCPLICLPFFVTHTIHTKDQLVKDNGEIVTTKLLQQLNSSDFKHMPVYTVSIGDDFRTVTFVLLGVVIKLVPCILLTILSLKIIGVLLETKKRRRLLFFNCGVPLVSIEQDGGGGTCGTVTTVSQQKRHLEKEQQTDRTTRMLLTVLLLFLITEFPQAILAMLILIYDDPRFAAQCYHPLGDLMDILALTNSAINFVLYCSMSRQFRSAFGVIFKLKGCEPCVRLPTHPRTEFNNGGTTQVTLV